MTEVLNVQQFGCSIAGVPISREINLRLAAGDIVAIVGESGSGKSVTFSRMFGLGAVSARCGKVYLNDEDFFAKTSQQQRLYRGRHIGFLFQDPSQAFNPCMRLGAQLIQACVYHLAWTKAAATAKALQLLRECEIESPEQCLRQYPHQLSGGMLQRVMLAMALMHEPALLVADEPTTALDQINTSKILELISRLCRDRQMACVLITHDFDVVASVATHVGVMYAGELVEFGDAETIVARPRHPYSQALQACRPRGQQLNKQMPLAVIPGQPPSLEHLPSGCAFHPRCSAAMQICQRQAPGSSEQLKCWLAAIEVADASL